MAVTRSRGAAFDDLDNDGDIDVVIVNSRKPPTLLRNDTPLAHWVEIRPQGTKSNRDGIGARITVVAGIQLRSPRFTADAYKAITACIHISASAREPG
jgi:hypothetical protein